MTYFDADVPGWALLLIASSVFAVSVGGPRVQARFPWAPAMTLATVAGLVAAFVAVAKWRGPGSHLELAAVSVVGWGFPAIASLSALAIFGRLGARPRVVVALVAGAVGSVFAVLAALVAACGLFGNCL